MARCKCRCCGNSLDTKTAYRVVIKEKNAYFCDEDCYNKYLADKAEQDKINAEYDEIYELTKQIFGYEFTGYSLIKREVNTWEKVGTRAKIIAYLKENKDWLSDVMSKEFASDFNRVRYYSVIVAGRLHDWKPKARVVEAPVATPQEPVEITDTTVNFYVNKKEKTKRRRGFSEEE